MSLQLFREIELQQNDMDLAYRHAGGPGDLVDIDRARPKRADDPPPLALRDFGQGFRRYPLLGGGQLRAERFDRAPEDRSARASTMSRALVTRQAPCLRRLLVPVECGSRGLPGTAKTSAALLAGKAGGDQRA